MRRTAVAATFSVFALALAACSGGGGSSDPAGGVGQGDLALAAGTGMVTGGRVTAEGITVDGVGRVSGTPDVLTVTLGVETVADTVDAAIADANEAASALLAALRDAGVADEDLQTRDLSVYPRYGRDGTDEVRRITGYEVRNIVEARIRDLDAAGQVIDAAVSAAGDAARVRGIGFELEDNAALLDAAREAAFADARAKAERYAELAGVELGGLVSLAEQYAPAPSPVALLAADVMEGAAMPIESGQQDLSVTVTTVWSIG